MHTCTLIIIKKCVAGAPPLMASVDGSKSIQTSSDEIFLRECGLCVSEGKTTEAKYFCKDCESNICDSCKSSHSRFEELRKHNIGAIDSNLDGAVGGKRSGCGVYCSRKWKYIVRHTTMLFALHVKALNIESVIPVICKRKVQIMILQDSKRC